jgi:hypothetical protein
MMHSTTTPKKLISISRHALVYAVLSLSCISALQADDWKPDEGFKSLFNGKDLTGWSFRAKVPRKSPEIGKVIEDFKGKVQSDELRRYSVKDGIIRVNFPDEKDRITGQLYTVAEFSTDFVLKLEFRAGVGADSGIFVRRPQLQCRDYLVAGPYKELKKYKPQEWNEITVVVKDGVAHCTCNGEVLEEALKLPAMGPIGLEGDKGLMEYRHIQIKAD